MCSALRGNSLRRHSIPVMSSMRTWTINRAKLGSHQPMFTFLVRSRMPPWAASATDSLSLANLIAHRVHPSLCAHCPKPSPHPGRHFFPSCLFPIKNSLVATEALSHHAGSKITAFSLGVSSWSCFDNLHT